MENNLAPALPLWLDILVSAAVLCGALIACIGSLGLLRLKTYFERVHAPSIIATMGCWCIMHASLIYFSVQQGFLALHVLLIALFVAVTVPITSIFLMRAALFRARRPSNAVSNSETSSVPGSLSRMVGSDHGIDS